MTRRHQLKLPWVTTAQEDGSSSEPIRFGASDGEASSSPRVSPRWAAALAVVLACAGVALLWPRNSTVAAPPSTSVTATSTPSARPAQLASPGPTPTSTPSAARTSSASASHPSTASSTLDPLAGDLNPARALELLRRSYPAHAPAAAGRRPVATAWAALKADLERGGYRHPNLLAGILTPSRAAAAGTQTAVLMWNATSPAGDRLSEQVSPVTLRVAGSKTVVISLDAPTDTP